MRRSYVVSVGCWACVSSVVALLMRVSGGRVGEAFQWMQGQFWQCMEKRSRDVELPYLVRPRCLDCPHPRSHAAWCEGKTVTGRRQAQT